MLKTLALCIALAATPALAQDRVATNGTDSVRLTQADCPSEILQLLPAIAVDKVKLASARVRGVEYRACWMPYGDDIALKYEDGDNGQIPASAFKPVPTT